MFQTFAQQTMQSKMDTTLAPLEGPTATNKDDVMQLFGEQLVPLGRPT